MSQSRDTRNIFPVRELLERKETAAELLPPRTMEHLGYAVLVANGAEPGEALAALSRLRRDFVDWNEIRVARIQELARSMGDVPEPEKSAKEIKEEYNGFFDKKGALAFDFLAAGKPAESKRQLAQILPRLPKGAALLLLYEFCPGASLPLSDEGLRQARRDGVVGKSGDRNQLSRVLIENMELPDAAILVQHWELEAHGAPYGEAPKKEAPKVGRKAPAKGKKPVRKS